MRRLADIFVSLAALIVLVPLLAAIALVVAADSPGGPFYGGWRAGRGGRRFRMWKFRTMVAGADRKGPSVTASRDARVTRVGEFLRKTKLDELPQFFNLLAGDLTLVGPRAEALDIVVVYTTEQRRLLEVKPGITGPGQLYYTTDQADAIPDGVAADQYYVQHLLDRKLRIDLDYIAHRTIASDLRMVLETVVLMARGLASKAGSTRKEKESH